MTGGISVLLVQISAFVLVLDVHVLETAACPNFIEVKPGHHENPTLYDINTKNTILYSTLLYYTMLYNTILCYTILVYKII